MFGNSVFDRYFTTNQCLKAKCGGLIANSVPRKAPYRHEVLTRWIWS